MCDLETAVANAGQNHELILALFDLDGFKQYNDTFGHPAGDALLARLADRLQQSVQGCATAYRMDGDEFCAILNKPARSTKKSGNSCAATPKSANGSSAPRRASPNPPSSCDPATSATTGTVVQIGSPARRSRSARG
jgi:GGDEF domain-containing protein